MKQKQVTKVDHIKAILALPFMVTIVVPSLIYFFIDKKPFDLFNSLPENVNTFCGGFFFAIGLLLFISTIWLFAVKGKRYFSSLESTG